MKWQRQRNDNEMSDQTVMMDETHNHKPGQTERAKYSSKTTRGSSRTDGTTLTEPWKIKEVQAIITIIAI